MSKYSKKKNAQKDTEAEEVSESQVVKIISEWKKSPKRLAKNKKMVQASVKLRDGSIVTRHLAVNV